MDEQEVNCSVCLEPFDEENHSPRTLRCGHTLCTICIIALLQKSINDRNCPECRKPLKITSFLHLPVSYTVLRLSRTLSDMNFKLVNELVEDGDVCLEHGSPIITWCKECWRAKCRRCKACGCGGVMALAEGLLHIKRERVDKTNAMIDALHKRKEYYENARDSLEADMAKLQERLDDVTKNLSAIEEALSTVEEDEAKVVEINSIKRIEKAIRQSEIRLEKFQVYLDEASEGLMPEAVSLSPPIDFEDLKNRLKITQSIYAIHTKVDGSMRWSKLSIQGKNLVLHAAEATPPPPNTTLVKFDRVREAMDQNHQLAFFDLKVDHRHEGRICIELRDTLRGENFLRFCLGNNGPSYKGLQIDKYPLQADGKEYIQCLNSGMFENVRHCTALVDDITTCDYEKVFHPGLVFGSETPECMSFFAICLGNMDGKLIRTSFGKVTSGVLALRNTLYEIRKGYKRASIGDCGIMISLE